MNFQYKYSIDLFGPSTIFGWCFHRLFSSRKLTLVFSVNSKEVGSCSADQYREDLKHRKIHPTGLCGFNFALAPDQQPFDENSSVTISLKESGTVLCTLPGDKIGSPDPTEGSLATRLRKRFSAKTKTAKPTFFMHIPKTGGTSFNIFAADLFPPSEIISHVELYDPKRYASLSHRYNYISGHLYCGEIRKYFSSGQYSCYTMIREPHAQLHSHLNWLRAIGEDKESQYYKSHPPVFQELAEIIGPRTELSPENLKSVLAKIFNHARELIDNYQSRHFLDDKMEKVEIGSWEEIEKNLRLFRAIGITEEFDHFQEFYCRENRLPPPAPTPPLNRSRHKPLYNHQDPLYREVVKPLVETDLLLYNFVTQKYWRRQTHQGQHDQTSEAKAERT